MDRLFMFFPGFKKKALTLSYDDGVAPDKRLIGIMCKYGLKGTFNVNGGLFAEQDADERGRMSARQAKALYPASGNEVAAHGYKHYSLACVPEPVALGDVLEDRKTLEKLFGGKPITGMAYANGSFNDRVAELLKACGITYCRTTRSTGGFALPEDWLQWHPTCHHDDPRLTELLEAFLNWKAEGYYWGQKPKLLYVWGHSYEFDNNQNWDKIEAFAQKAGGRDDVWYATNGEIYRYCQAFDRLEYSVDGKVVHNPSDIDVYYDYYTKPVLIQAGATVDLEEGKEV